MKAIYGFLGIFVIIVATIFISQECQRGTQSNAAEDTTLAKKYEALTNLHQQYVIRTDKEIDSLVKSKNLVQAELTVLKSQLPRGTTRLSNVVYNSRTVSTRVQTVPKSATPDVRTVTVISQDTTCVGKLAQVETINQDLINYINNNTISLPYTAFFSDSTINMSLSLEVDATGLLKETWDADIRNDLIITHTTKRRGIWPFRKKRHYVTIEQTNPEIVDMKIQGYLIK